MNTSFAKVSFVADDEVKYEVRIRTDDGQLAYHRLRSLLERYGERVSLPPGLTMELIDAYEHKSKALKRTEKELAEANAEVRTADDAAMLALYSRLRTVAEHVTCYMNSLGPNASISDPAAFAFLRELCSLISESDEFFEKADSDDKK